MNKELFADNMVSCLRPRRHNRSRNSGLQLRHFLCCVLQTANGWLTHYVYINDLSPLTF